MKGFPNLLRTATLVTSMMERRRGRQRAQRRVATSFTYELASLHLQALLAMAGADGAVTRAEYDEAVAFLDRASIQPDDVARLRVLAPLFADAPPQMEVLLEPLAAFAAHPARARALATDLARVVAVERRGHPRELLMMDEFCAAIGVATAFAQPQSAADVDVRERAERPAIDFASQRRIRESVHRALDASYAA